MSHGKNVVCGIQAVSVLARRVQVGSVLGSYDTMNDSRWVNGKLSTQDFDASYELFEIMS